MEFTLQASIATDTTIEPYTVRMPNPVQSQSAAANSGTFTASMVQPGKLKTIDYGLSLLTRLRRSA